MKRCRHLIAERAVRTFGVVIASPLLELDARMAERTEQCLVQKLVAQATIEAFDEGILLRLTGVDMVPVETKTVCPTQHRQAGELRAVVRYALLRQATPGDHSFQLAD